MLGKQGNHDEIASLQHRQFSIACVSGWCFSCEALYIEDLGIFQSNPASIDEEERTSWFEV